MRLTDEGTRRMLRIEQGQVERKAAMGRIDSVTINKPRQPSMPKMPWSDHGDDDADTNGDSRGTP